MDIEVIEKKPLTLIEVEKTISRLGKKSELPSIQQKIHTFAKRFSKIKEADAQKLADELRALQIPMFSEEYIAAVIDIMPRDLAELKSIFAGAKITFSSESFKKILDIILKYKTK